MRRLDGDIGKVKEFYFDDSHWTIRYLVDDTGNWLAERKVPISPYSLTDVNKPERYIAVDLTRKQIWGSPPLDSDKPASQQFEESYYEYYGQPKYWNGPLVWGAYPYIVRDPKMWINPAEGKKKWDRHLHSAYDVSGYKIHATDGEIGHVDNFVIDDETWTIRYLIVDTRNWWTGKKVLIAPQWIKSISWPDSEVFVKLTRDAIKKSPKCNEETLPNRFFGLNCIDITIIQATGRINW